MSEQTKQTEPQIRVRLQHSHTLKDGWRLSETTVEWVGSGDPAWGDIDFAMRQSFHHGSVEASKRNDDEARRSS